MMRFVRLAALAAIACSFALLAGGGNANAHGIPDQFLQGGPGCLQSVMKASAPSTGALRQEFVPASSILGGVNICLTTPGTTFVNMSIRSGTAAAPGPVLASGNTTVNQNDNIWAHVELASALTVTPGTPLVIELASLQQFEWRGICGQAGGNCAPGDVMDRYPAGVASAAPVVSDFGFVTYTPNDLDGDGVVDGVDNCPVDPNTGQENDDRNFIELGGYGKLYDDLTWPNSDTAGNVCDSDDDNDELGDSIETGLPGPQCPPATGPTNPLLRDTDGDRALDGVECVMGSDPTNPASVPPNPIAGTDPDGDRLSTALENQLGSNPNVADSDGDKLSDGIEYKHYNTFATSVNTDGDACGDAKEAASINADTQVNVIDLAQIAAAAGNQTAPNYIPHFDFTKNGNIDVIDLQLVAQQAGACF